MKLVRKDNNQINKVIFEMHMKDAVMVVEFTVEYLAASGSHLAELLLDAFKAVAKKDYPDYLELIDLYFKELLKIEKNQDFNFKPAPKPSSWGNEVGRSPVIDQLPGVKENVKHPISKTVAPLEKIIIDLNDHHKWTLNQIADWIETLDIDINFKNGGENNE